MAFIRDEKTVVESTRIESTPTASLKVSNPPLATVGTIWTSINALWQNLGTNWTDIASTYKTISNSKVASTRVVNTVTSSTKV